jgi:membrane protein implicated in regulation of membrane protease activity
VSTAGDRDVNLDIGERVHVAAWASDGTARVPYRGSTWQARLQPGALAAPGNHVVAAVEGNWLVLVPAIAGR